MVYTRVKNISYIKNISTYYAKYNSENEEKIGYMFSALNEGSDPNFSKAKCMIIAENEAHPPLGAKEVLSEFQKVGEGELFVARWHHFYKGIWVESDFIQVMVNRATGKIFGHQRHWHDVDTGLLVR